MLVQTNDFIKRNIVRVIDGGGHFRGNAFFLRKEYCVTAHHILDSFEEIRVDINNKRISAVYDQNCSDKKKDIAFLKVNDPTAKPLECSKDISFDLAVLIEGFPSKSNPEFQEAREIRG